MTSRSRSPLDVDRRRLIEVAFPLEQVSKDSVHEKNVRHRHISTLHIWPARRPLAASRGVILSTLLPDSGDSGERRRVLERMAGHWVVIRDEDGEVVDRVWKDGIFHWGKENRRELDAFREEVREAFGGRTPRVLDPFAGGGAIPLEAMRLGCEVEAADLNPVAWFILRCTLHYPRLTSGERRLPESLSAYPLFGEAIRWAADREAASDGGRRRGRRRKVGSEAGPALLTPGLAGAPAVPFAWHLRAWGERVLAGARRESRRGIRCMRTSSRNGGKGGGGTTTCRLSSSSPGPCGSWRRMTKGRYRWTR